jgi:NitT/TauT family transport system permease protein/taurine transport system permease protein
MTVREAFLRRTTTIPSTRLRLRFNPQLLWLPASGALAFALWSLLSLAFNPRLFPPPTIVLQAGWEMLLSGELWTDVWQTAFRVLVGFVAGCITGVTIGALLGHITTLRMLLQPIVGFVRNLSPVAIIPLAIIWFGIGETSKYFVVFWGTVFFVMFATMHAVQNVPRIRIRAAQCFGASNARVLMDIVIPSSIPYIWSGMRVALASSIMSVVAAELLAAQSGLGYLIMQSRVMIQTERMFVGLIALASLGLFLDACFVQLGHLTLRRYTTYLSK